MRYIALLLAVLAVACGPNRVDLPGTTTVDPSFTTEQTEVIFAAADQWREATNGAADLKLEIGAGGVLHIHPVDSKGTAMGDTHTYDGSGTMAIDTALCGLMAPRYHVSDADTLTDTVLHEMGHAFGLQHVETGLMRASGYGGGCVDQQSVDRFCELYDCPAGTHATCAPGSGDAGATGAP